MKTVLINILATLLLILAFDVAMFRFLPAEYSSWADQYRRARARLHQHLTPTGPGDSQFPRDYFVRHPTRGFDIGTNKKGYHTVDGISYPIWSNSLGCFDVEHSEYDRYIYIAGDSFAWGYSPLEQNFGSIIRNALGIPVLQCGVPHSGQRHQYEKLVEIVERVHSLPKAILVFYFSNDVVDDYLHPHSTVIDGWLVDTVSVDENDRIVKHTEDELRIRLSEKMEEFAREEAARASWWGRAKSALKHYSLTANMLVYLRNYAIAWIDLPVFTTMTTAPLRRSLYALGHKERGGAHWFSDNPMAQPNKTALLAFKKFSVQMNIPIVIVLVPNKYRTTPRWYEEVRQFLVENGIRYVDLTLKMLERGLPMNDLFWPRDGHLNPTGKAAAAQILNEELSALIPQ